MFWVPMVSKDHHDSTVNMKSEEWRLHYSNTDLIVTDILSRNIERQLSFYSYHSDKAISELRSQ